MMTYYAGVFNVDPLWIDSETIACFPARREKAPRCPVEVHLDRPTDLARR